MRKSGEERDRHGRTCEVDEADDGGGRTCVRWTRDDGCGAVRCTTVDVDVDGRRIDGGRARTDGPALQQPQIILLREGTEASQGKAHVLSNIDACLAVADIVRTTLGPRGMDKLIYDNEVRAWKQLTGWLTSDRTRWRCRRG